MTERDGFVDGNLARLEALLKLLAQPFDKFDLDVLKSGFKTYSNYCIEVDFRTLIVNDY